MSRASRAYRHWSKDFLDPYVEYGQLNFLGFVPLYNLSEYLWEKFAQKNKSLFNVATTFFVVPNLAKSRRASLLRVYKWILREPQIYNL
jgi:hypothetical protein